MGKYILNKRIALRSWTNVIAAYYIRGNQKPFAIHDSELDVLKKCNGVTDLEMNEPLLNLIERGFVREAKEGDMLSEWQKYRYFNNPVVPYMTLEITQRCNFNCLHCFNAGGLQVPRNELSYDQIVKILDQAVECGIQNILMTGGEPMLHKDFMKIMHAIYDRNLWVYELNTNGYFLTKEILQEMKNSHMNPKMKISFDGLGYHDVIRNFNGCEQKTLDAIALCKEFGFDVRVQMQMNKFNLDTILPSLLKLDSMGVDEVRISRTTESPRWNITCPGGSIRWSEFFEKGVQIASDYVKSGNRKMYLEYWPFLSIYPEKKKFACWDIRYNEETFNLSRPLCKCNNGNISIGSNGNVYPCMQMSGAMDGLGVLLGNLFTTPLQEILTNSLYSKIAHACVRERAERNGRCGKCPFFHYCGGGCTLQGMIFNADLFGADNSCCVFHRDGWHKKIADTFKGWRDARPIPDDIDPQYLIDLNIDEVPHIDMEVLAASKIGLLNYLKHGSSEDRDVL